MLSVALLICIVWNLGHGDINFRSLKEEKNKRVTVATTTQLLPTPTPAQVIDGPVTRSRAKKLQQELHALLCEIHFNINENYILPDSEE